MAVRRHQACESRGMRAQADWKIVERGWHAHVLGEAEHKFLSALGAIKKLRVTCKFPHLTLNSPHPSLTRGPKSAAQHCSFDCMPS